MKNVIFLIFINCLVSCQYFKKNVPLKEQLLNQELKKINWSDVDEFPSLLTCDSVEVPETRKKCFFDFLGISMRNKLLRDSIKLKFPKLDTIQIEVTVLANSNLNVHSEFEKFKTIYDTSKLDSILKNKLTNFLAVEPAIKRGVKVNSQFIIPIILD